MAKINKILICILIAALICPSDAFARKHKKPRRAVPYCPSADTAILIDFDHHKRYYGKGIDTQVYPASTTKVLTALLVLEKLPLDQYVTVSERATQVQPTKLGLVAGERYRVRDLLYALLLKSANDAAVVLAEAVGGTEANFVRMMNARARQIGAHHTLFANSHGLPSTGRQFTTAYDMALMFRKALRKEFFRKAISFKYRIIYSKDGRRHFLKSHNKSLFLNWKKDVLGKTGYTRDAQSCFVGYVMKGRDIVIVAVFGCNKRWEDVKFIIKRYGQISL